MKKKPYIPEINWYTGQVSVMAIMENWSNGYRTFPRNAGATFRPKKPKAKRPRR